jgi:hypothetical protein
MRLRLTRAVVCASTVVVASCDLLSPADELVTEIRLSPLVVGLGEKVRITVITTNRSSTAVQTYGCGPGLGYEVTLPDGSRRQPLEGLAYTCPLHDSNLLEPAETDTLEFEWQPPEQRGTYVVQGGVRLRHLVALSSPRTFDVR